MAKTFTNEPLGLGFRYSVKTERGHYIMGRSWIDTTSPSDMMDYCQFSSIADLISESVKTHSDWCRNQVAGAL